MVYGASPSLFVPTLLFVALTVSLIPHVCQCGKAVQCFCVPMSPGKGHHQLHCSLHPQLSILPQMARIFVGATEGVVEH